MGNVQGATMAMYRGVNASQPKNTCALYCALRRGITADTARRRKQRCMIFWIRPSVRKLLPADEYLAR